MTGLRDLLAQASPGDWVAFQDEYGWHVENGLYEYTLSHRSEADAHLIALAPSLAGLVLDMADALAAHQGEHVLCTCNQCVADRALLARVEGIAKETA